VTQTKPVINIAILGSPIICEGFKSMIAPYDNLVITIETSNGQILFDLAQAVTIVPDICILDIDITDVQHNNIARQIKQNWPSIKILAVSINRLESTVSAVLQNPIVGYLPQYLNKKDIYNALLAVYEKRHYHLHITSSELIEKFMLTFSKN